VQQQLPTPAPSRTLQNAAASCGGPSQQQQQPTIERGSLASSAAPYPPQAQQEQRRQHQLAAHDPYESARRAALLTLSSRSPVAAAVDKLPPRGGPAPAAAGQHGGGSGGALSTKYRLAGVMKELGYAVTANADAFQALLSQFRGLDEASVAGVLGLLATTHKGLQPDGLGLADTMRTILTSSGSGGAAAAQAGSSGAGASAAGWNVAVVMDSIKAAAPALSWQRVAEALDYEGFAVPDAAGFSLLMAAWRRATSEPFPLTAIAGRLWANAPGQLSLLVQAVSAPPDVLSWERSPKKIAPLEGMGQGKSPLGTPNQAWASLDLLAVLAQMAELPRLGPSVLELLRRGPVASCPEVLVACTAFLRGPHDLAWGSMERYVWDSVAAPLLFDGAPSSSRNVLLQRLWAQRRDALLQAMAHYRTERPERLSELLDVLGEVKGMPGALDTAPPALAVALAALAAQRKALDLDAWLAGACARDATSGSMMQAAIAFLEGQLSGIAEGRLQPAPPAAAAGSGRTTSSSGGAGPGVASLGAESATAFLRALYTAGAGVLPGLANQLVRVLELGKKAFPSAEAALAAAAASPLAGSAADSGLAGGSGGGTFPEAIELEANGYFQKLYHERQPVEELVAQLTVFRAGSQHQQLVFACMVHNLFDEYRFFPNYPDQELDTTAALFGALLHHALLTNITLDMALRHVLDALAQPPDSKMFRFGLGAARQVQPDLAGWPAFCERALAIPHLKAADPALHALMVASAQAAAEAAGGGGGGSGSGGGGGGGGAATAAGGSSGGADKAADGSSTTTPTAAPAAGSGGGSSSSSMPNGTTSSTAKGSEAAPAAQQGARSAAPGATAAKAAGAANGPQPAAAAKAGGAVGAKAAGGAASGGGGGVPSMDPDDGSAVASQAASLALNDKPERLMLNMTLNNETLDVAERKRDDTAAPNDATTDKVCVCVCVCVSVCLSRRGCHLMRRGGVQQGPCQLSRPARS
jgi:CCR4-NOT transcription complex subunit 1